MDTSGPLSSFLKHIFGKISKKYESESIDMNFLAILLS